MTLRGKYALVARGELAAESLSSLGNPEQKLPFITIRKKIRPKRLSKNCEPAARMVLFCRPTFANRKKFAG